MADTAVVEHDEVLQGGTLTLFQEDGEHRLVLAAPRQGLPQQGVVAVYGDGRLRAKLCVTESNDGQLSLRVDSGVETVQVDAGSDDGRRSPRFVLTNAEEGGGRIELGFDKDGPYLKLARGLNEVTLSLARGLEVPRFFVGLVSDQAAR